MPDQKLLEYIKQQQQKKAKQEDIKNILISIGWNEKDIDEAFAYLADPKNEFVAGNPLIPPVSSIKSGSALLKEAWEICKPRFGTFVGISIIPTAVIAFVTFILLGGAIMNTAVISQMMDPKNIVITVVSVFLFVVFLVVLQLFGQVALIYAIKDRNEEIGVRESYKRAAGKVLSYFWVYLLMGSVIVGGFFFFFVPGIIFSISLIFALYICIFEDKKGIEALLQSRGYVRGEWREVFVCLLFIGVVTFLISLAADIVFAIFPVPYIGDIGKFAVSLFIAPVSMTYMILLYQNVKEFKSGSILTAEKNKRSILISFGVFGAVIVLALLSVMVYFSGPIMKALKESEQEKTQNTDTSSLFVSPIENVRMKGRDAARMSSVIGIQAAMELFYDEKGAYPTSLIELSPIMGSGASQSYMTDPLTKKPYRYQILSNGEDYSLCVDLEVSKMEKCVRNESFIPPTSTSTTL